jgi:mono/diheme cytochrome c family protein
MALRYRTDDELEKSTNQWMAVGAGLLVTMALVFPFYRWYEPASRDQARTEQAAALAAEGETVWSTNCSACHGLNGEGAIGPALNSKQFMQAATDDQMATLIAVGVPGTQMSAYSLDHGGPLTSEQIRSVVAFIRSWEPDAPDNPDWRAMIDGGG